MDRLASFDFAAHNEDVRAVWAAYHTGKPTRTPIIFGTNPRFFMQEPTANTEGYEFRRYSEDPDVMFEAQLRFQRWSRSNLLQDTELGTPEHWSVYADFQNYYEAAWFGCPVEYYADQVPDTRPAYADHPERLIENGIPDPFGGIMGKAIEYYEHFRARAERETYLDLPIKAARPGMGMGTDGPMTVACNLFGPDQVCLMMAAEPERLQTLLRFITEATIARMRAWRERYDVPIPSPGFGMADDSIALVSTVMYREHILPHHRRIYSTFGTDAPGSIHLCGDATRHFVTLRDELNIGEFDTGFPVDFGKLRRELGPDARILGGPHVELLMHATPAQVRDEVRRIMESGILDGGLFVLREGNNLAPRTPLDNCDALYHAGREFGKLLEGEAPAEPRLSTI